MAVNPIMSSGRTPVDAFSAGVTGIQAGLRGMGHAAQEVAELNVRDAAGAPPPDHTRSAVEAITDLKIYERNVQAATVVVKTADEVMGFLLDIHA